MISSLRNIFSLRCSMITFLHKWIIRDLDGYSFIRFDDSWKMTKYIYISRLYVFIYVHIHIYIYIYIYIKNFYSYTSHSCFFKQIFNSPSFSFHWFRSSSFSVRRMNLLSFLFDPYDICKKKKHLICQSYEFQMILTIVVELFQIWFHVTFVKIHFRVIDNLINVTTVVIF